jgi:DNA-binding CsgD family transcriptional regulator
MVKRGRPLENLVLTGDEREILELWARQPQNVQALALRCRDLLEYAKGGTNIEMAERLFVTRAKVGKWRRR